ncbi:NAD(P)H-dependent oxidoreductase [Parvularcula lutaonensis]|uniref:NAD(P)H-dependent oxidoreductase n=1 Tax=Parvularcula lutaonensis TaxID=491923 RepID=A0ABV7M704_9PROT|nr:NAD(P)H-dependent oxidoreductase [Parvularcula lutaonensis]GGY56156.1 hypothetical protein GCM10007148_27120 [Parvularcula lutaonensis]
MVEPKRITLLLGHPSRNRSYCRALAERYRDAAVKAGHGISFFDGASLDVPFLHNTEEFESGEPPESVRPLQAAISEGEHFVIVFPMWMGTLPAYTKALIEQTFRPGFALDMSDPTSFPKQLMKGKSARIIMTMGMPAAAYRFIFRAHGLKNLERSLLGLCGFKPIRSTLIGRVEAGGSEYRERWLRRIDKLGAKAA